jgi:hypothetical protein
MRKNNLVTVDRSRRFDRPGTRFVRPVPPSPMVLQTLMQSLNDLQHKVDALAAKPSEIVEVKPVESKEVESKPSADTRDKKLNRKSLLNMFD